MMMVNIAPELGYLDETLCSIRFAEKVNQTELGQAKARVVEGRGAQAHGGQKRKAPGASELQACAISDRSSRRSRGATTAEGAVTKSVTRGKTKTLGKRRKRSSSSKIKALAANLNIDPSRIGKSRPTPGRSVSGRKSAAKVEAAAAAAAAASAVAAGARTLPPVVEEEMEEEESVVPSPSKLVHATLARAVVVAQRRPPAKKRRTKFNLSK